MTIYPSKLPECESCDIAYVCNLAEKLAEIGCAELSPLELSCRLYTYSSSSIAIEKPKEPEPLEATPKRERPAPPKEPESVETMFQKPSPKEPETDGGGVKTGKSERKKAEYNKTCEGCGKSFIAAGARKRYCPVCEGTGAIKTDETETPEERKAWMKEMTKEHMHSNG